MGPSLEDRVNNFNILRLAFAALVVVSHSTEMLDGNDRREILSRFCGTITAGGLAVDGFFLISGYLVTKSFVDTQDPIDYVRKRVLRIYPGFLLCYLLCVTVVAYLAGAHLPTFHGALKIAAQAVFLRPPRLNTEFESLPYAQLNGAMWTISFEFCCYVLVAGIGLLGLLRHRHMVLGAALLLVVLNALREVTHLPFDLAQSIRLFGIFLIGGCFYLYRAELPLKGSAAAAAAVVMIVCLFFGTMDQVGLTLAGGYCLFWFAFKGSGRRFSASIRTDLSYGLYLYAWPVEALLIYHVRGIGPVGAGIATLAIAMALAFVSWVLVERPAMTLARRSLPRWMRAAKPPAADPARAAPGVQGAGTSG